MTKKESRLAANFPYLIWTLIPVPLLFFWFQSRTIDFDSLAIGFDVVVVWERKYFVEVNQKLFH